MIISLTRRVARESDVAVIGATLIQYVVRFGTNIALSHLLFPEAFGLVAITSTVLIGLQLLFEAAIFVSLLNRKGDVPHAEQDLFWSLAVMRGGAILAVTALIAPAISYAYGEPALLLLLIAGAGSTALTGFASLDPMLRMKRGRPAKNLLIEMLRQLVTACSCIAIATVWASPFALVLGGYVATATCVVASHVGADYRPRFRMTKPFLVAQLKFVRWFQLTSLCQFFGQQIDRLVFPIFFSTAAFGVYSIAQGLATIPAMLGQRWTFELYLPAVQRVVHDGDLPTHPDALRPRAVALGYLAIVCAAVVGGASPFFRLIYPADFQAAALYTPLLAIAAFLTISEGVLRAVFIVMRRQKYETFGEISRAAIFLAILFLFVRGPDQSPVAYIHAYIATQFVIWAGFVNIGRVLGLTKLRVDLLPLGGFAIGAALLYGLGQLVAERLGLIPAMLAVTLGAGAMTLTLYLRYGLPRPHRAAG